MPKVRFVTSTFESEKDLLNCFGFGDGVLLWSEVIFHHHPGLKKDNLEKYVKDYLLSHNKEILTSVSRFQAAWDKKGSNILSVISDLLEIEWPKDRNEIVAGVSVCPINPRFLKRWSFNVFYKHNEKEVLRTSAHEMLHFLYFEKWKEVFPESKEEEFDSPHFVWLLSEILAPVLLNTKEMQRILKQRDSLYPEFDDIRLNGRRVEEYFSELYESGKKKGQSFSEFLKGAYSKAREFEVELNTVLKK